MRLAYDLKRDTEAGRPTVKAKVQRQSSKSFWLIGLDGYSRIVIRALPIIPGRKKGIAGRNALESPV